MKCPNCGTGIHLETDTCDFFAEEGTYGSPGITIEVGFCPECKKPIVIMKSGKVLDFDSRGNEILSIDTEQRLYPPQEKPTILDPLIPPKYESLFHESELVNNISPRSSATLSRYLLQMLLHEELHIEKRNLEQELDELEKGSEVPSNLITIRADVTLNDIVYVSGEARSDNLLLCNNTQKLKTVNIHGLKGVDTTPQMTGYIKNAAWRYENEVRIRTELPYSVGKEKIMIKIPDYVLSAITVMEGPSFVYKTDDICKLLHSQYRIAESAFTGLLKYRSLCSLCAHGAFEKK